MAIWRKHHLLSLDDEDKQDKVMAGSEFIVYYIGSTYGYENSEQTEKLLEEFLDNFVCSFQMKKYSMFRLLVDFSGAALNDSEGHIFRRFELCNIKDVIFSDNVQKYSKYFVLVGREESDINVKSHVLICENKEKARGLYQTFIETFELGVEMARRKHDKVSYAEVFGEAFPRSTDLEETGKPVEENRNPFQKRQ